MIYYHNVQLLNAGVLNVVMMDHIFLKAFVLTETYDPDGNAHEPWSLGVNRSGPDTIGFLMVSAIPLSIPKKILS